MSAEELIAALRAGVARGDGAGALSPLIDALAAELAERRAMEARVRRSHEAMMRLARSAHIGEGRVPEALAEIATRAAEVLGVARSSIWTYDADQSAIHCIELFVRDTGTHESGVVLAASSYPAYFRALREERSIAASDAHTDPRTAEFSAGYLTPLGIGAMLDAPIRVGGRMIGVLCNEHVGQARSWSTDEEQLASSLADFVALAIESGKRAEVEAQLRAVVAVLDESA